MAQRAAGTAFGPMVIVALDQYRPDPLVPDELAARMLPGSARAVVALARWNAVERFVHRMSERHIPGIWGSMLCRKRYIDEVLARDAADGMDSVVILGAGLDTRAYRLPALARVPVYEVDLPVNIELKRDRLVALHRAVPDNVTLVPTDFGTEDLTDTLSAAGYRPGDRSAFVWEAVTQYLTEDAVRGTFRFLAKAAGGSRLVFTFVRQDFLDGRQMYGAEAAYRDFVTKSGLWRFGMEPDEVAEFLAGYGWRQLEQLGSAEFRTRYVWPSGRRLPVSEIERTVHAAKT
jgi:methyltransferase (TIGR00027 family)